MMSTGKHFSFESIHFEEAIAHGGSRSIFFHRACEKSDGSAYNFLDFTIVPVGADIGVHTHKRDNQEVYVVVSGRGLMYLDGCEFEVETGHVVINRPGGAHGLKNIGDTDLKLVVIEIPLSNQA
jgi:mannose-6-phosphate isomerase-like protein (cupin superfamily)